MRWQNWLLLAALADWLIERTLSRAAIFMPKSAVMVSVTQAMTFVGQVAFNLAAILTLAATAWLALRGFSRAGRHLARSLALAGLVGLSVLGVFVAPGPIAQLLFHALTLVALASLAANGLRARRGVGWRLAVIVPVLAIGAMTLFKIDHALGLLSGQSGGPHLALAMFQIGELLVVLTPFVAWRAHGRIGRARDWLVAAIPAALFSVAYFANPSLTATMATWSIGLSLYLPWPVYAISLLLATLTIVRALRAGRSAGYGLVFLTAAGYAMQLSSQVMLGLLGVRMLGLEQLPGWPTRSIRVDQASPSPAVP